MRGDAWVRGQGVGGMHGGVVKIMLGNLCIGQDEVQKVVGGMAVK